MDSSSLALIIVNFNRDLNTFQCSLESEKLFLHSENCSHMCNHKSKSQCFRSSFSPTKPSVEHLSPACINLRCQTENRVNQLLILLQSITVLQSVFPFRCVTSLISLMKCEITEWVESDGTAHLIVALSCVSFTTKSADRKQKDLSFFLHCKTKDSVLGFRL